MNQDTFVSVWGNNPPEDDRQRSYFIWDLSQTTNVTYRLAKEAANKKNYHAMECVKYVNGNRPSEEEQRLLDIEERLARIESQLNI